jgi:hypothetical protein
VSEQFNEQELIQHIANKTNVDEKSIKIVLKHEQAFINNAKSDAKGEVDIDLDDLIDYVLSKPDVKLDEMTVEDILDTEMSFLVEKGVAGYLD